MLNYQRVSSSCLTDEFMSSLAAAISIHFCFPSPVRSPVSREAAAKEGKWIQSPSSPSFRASTGLDLRERQPQKMKIFPYRITLWASMVHLVMKKIMI